MQSQTYGIAILITNLVQVESEQKVAEPCQCDFCLELSQ